MMCLKYILVIYCVLISALVVDGRQAQGRKPKFLSFNTLDGDVTVDLEFSIPFITIPVKKTMEAGFGSTGLGLPTLNINLAGLAIGGVVVLGTLVVIPVLMKTLALLHPKQHYARFIDNTEFGADKVLEFTKHLMMDSRTLQGCTLRVACWSARMSAGHDAGYLLNQVSGNTILSTMINATALEEAISYGRHGGACTAYGPCSLQEDHLPVLYNSIAAFGKRRTTTVP